MSMNIIYHIVTKKSWDDQIESSQYVHESLEIEGFIHASRAYQVEGVLERYYQGVEDLFKLTIDADLLLDSSRLKEEMADSIGELFPHIYGPINKSAIIEVVKIR